MFGTQSPPKYGKFKLEDSKETDSIASCVSKDSLQRSGSLHSTGSTSGLLINALEKHQSSQQHHTQYQSHCQYYGQYQYGSSSSGNSRGSSSSTGGHMKRGGKKHNWGNRERAGMSFLIVIAFFAVFGLIILTELFMIDERHAGMVMLHHGGGYGYGGRLSDSMPDYDNVKDDYDLLEESPAGDNKLGFIQFQDNKLKIQDAGSIDNGRLAGVLLNSGTNGLAAAGVVGGDHGNALTGGLGIGGVPPMPWGKVLPATIEQTLPGFPVGLTPMDGAWQVVNGTRFKFFVFSAFYDRRDGSRLVRIVGATKTRGPERVVCRFWYRLPHTNTTANIGRRSRYSSATVSARVKVIRENWNLKYSACFVLCPVRSTDAEVPRYVSVVSMSRYSLRGPPGNLLEVRNTDWDTELVTLAAPATSVPRSKASNRTRVTATPSTPRAGNFTLPSGHDIPDKIAVCVKPFHFNYDQALYLIEYLELYALMGVSHFTFYNHTIGPHASCILEHYVNGSIPDDVTAWDVDPLARAEADLGANRSPNSSIPTMATVPPLKRIRSLNYARPTVTMLPWNLRMRSQKEIRTEGLFAALNDCLYRSMYRYRYLALVDLDEYIVPRRNDTLKDLIDSLNSRFRKRELGAYSFQNAFFYLQFGDDPLVVQQEGKSALDATAQLRAALVTQRKTRRRFKLHPQKQRSKYICRPEAVIEAGNHFVWEFSPGKGTLNVPPTEAILQHYRVCEFGGNDCIKAPSIVDRTATKYVNRLVQRVGDVYRHLKQACQLPEFPPVPVLPKVFKDIELNADIDKKTSKPSSIPNSNADKPGKASKLSKAMNSTKSMTAGAFDARVDHRPINATTVRNDKPGLGNLNLSGPQRKRKKMIVFEQDADGQPRVRIQYV